MKSRRYQSQLVSKFQCITTFACILMSAAFGASVARADEPIDQLVRQLKQPSARGRMVAVERLARIGKQASPATDAIVACLSDVDNDVAIGATYALVCIQTDNVRALRALLPLLNDPDEHVRYSAEWAIAHIAKDISFEQPRTDGRELTIVLEQSVKTLASIQHQPRNMAAIELALSCLARKVQDESPPAQKSLGEDDSFADSVSLAKSVYEASDTLGRYQFVHRLADSSKFPDSLRQIVLDLESQNAEYLILQYALARWGDVGQRNLANLIESIPEERVLTESEARLIQHLVPITAEMQERLFHWSADRQQDPSVRLSAIASLAKSRPVSSVCIMHLIALMSDKNVDTELQVEAAYALESIGPAAAGAEQRLAVALAESTDERMRRAALDALISVSPHSPSSVALIVSQLGRIDAEEPILESLIQASGRYGKLASTAVPHLTRFLTNDSSDVRAASARSLGQIGLATQPAIASLVARIVDNNEEICVKNRAAAALKQLGPIVLPSLVDAIQTSDLQGQESVLRALTIIGIMSNEASDKCFGIMNEEQLPPQLRVAAIHALGSMGSEATRSAAGIVSHILKRCSANECVTVRAASLIASARINPLESKETIRLQLDDPDLLVRASAAYAFHLCGESRSGFETLLGMLCGEETDNVVEQTIQDFGWVVDAWLVEVACDSSSDRYRRMTCFSMACNVISPAWSKLLPLVEDVELGEEFTRLLEGHWHTSAEDNSDARAAAIDTMLAVLEGGQLSPVARARIAGLLTPDGLGAGQEDEDWQGFALSKPQATSSLSAANAASRAAIEASIESLEPGSGPLSSIEMEPKRAQAMIQPTNPPRAGGAASPSDNATHLSSEFDVFYGTNRSREKHRSVTHENAATILATIAGCFGVMFACLLGFARSGKRGLAVIALMLVGFLVPMGLYSAYTLSVQGLNSLVSYGGDFRDEIEYGTCKVSIPLNHQPGLLEAPSLLKLQFKSDPNEHVLLTQVKPLSQDSFISELHSMQARKGKNLLVFIHGYNVSFEDAARRTAQMSADLKFPGASVFYSWPSQANWYGYSTDQENIQLSVKHIKSFLLELAHRSEADSINLVAHSMGNVGLTEALKEMDNKNEKPLFNQVVLAAPDIDADIFRNKIVTHIIAKAHRMTLYTSQSDLALVASRYFNHGQRVGDSGEGVPFYPGIETIDATQVDSSLLGHTYYGGNVSVLNDIGSLLENQPIGDRRYLRKISEGTTPYWAFDPVWISQHQAEKPTR